MRGPEYRFKGPYFGSGHPTPPGGVSKVRTQSKDPEFFGAQGVLKMLIFGPPPGDGKSKVRNCHFWAAYGGNQARTRVEMAF